MVKPKKLNKGDKVAVISPSNSISYRRDLFDKAKEVLEKKLEIEIVASPNCFADYYYSAGTTQERLDDFHWALNNDEIKAIFFSVGGNTGVDLLEGLDYELIKNNPKIICGISDATTILNAITAKTDLITFVGLELLDLARFDNMDYEIQSLKKTFFDGNIGKVEQNKNWKPLDDNYSTYREWSTIKNGTMKGRIVGGNFSSFYQLMDTEYSLDFENNILIMEAYKFPKKKLHQALMQLKIKGVLNKINGLIIGYCLGSDDEEVRGNDRDIKDIALEITKDYNFPIIHIGEFGHKIENIIMPIGAKATFDVDKKEFVIEENVCI